MRGENVTWEHVRQAVAPEEPKDVVYRAIWLLSCVGYRDRANRALQKRIDVFCDQERLYLPLDHTMPPNLEPATGRFLAHFGATTVTAWDEFRDNFAEVPLAAFRPEHPSIHIPNGLASRGVHGLHLPDPGVLLTWQFDCTEALVAMSDRALRQARPEEFFEGWYADETTYRDVYNPRDFFERET